MNKQIVKIILEKTFILSVAMGFTLSSCGIDEGTLYDEKTLLDGPRTIDKKSGSSDAELEEPEEEINNGDNLTEDEVLDDTAIDPSTLVVNSWFRADFDLSSALRLVDNEDPDSDLSLAKDTVAEQLGLVTAQDGVQVQQTYGDGVSKSQGMQEIINTPGDQEVDLDAGNVGASGFQSYDRVTDDENCAGVFVCIPKLEFKPNIGEPMTICFYDQSGAKSVAIPYANVPGYEYTAYQEQFGTHGPYRAVRYRATGVDCENPKVDGDLFEEFQIKFSGALLGSDQLDRLFQNPTSFNVDQMLMFENQRLVNDNISPYLDETVKLQKSSRTFIDSEQRTMVKMIKTVRSSVKLNFFQDLFLDMNGLEVDLHFELCEDRLKDEGGQYCD